MSELIMATDDAPTIHNSLSVCLRSAGDEVKDFPDGVEALNWLASREEIIPVLIVVDLGLPRLDCYDEISQLKPDMAWRRR